jgi:hypothetical protein
VEGALRCKLCGADARGAARSSGAGVSFTVTSIVGERTERTLRLLAELEQLAPEVFLWMKTHPKERDRLLELLEALYGSEGKR